MRCSVQIILYLLTLLSLVLVALTVWVYATQQRVHVLGGQWPNAPITRPRMFASVDSSRAHFTRMHVSDGKSRPETFGRERYAYGFWVTNSPGVAMTSTATVGFCSNVSVPTWWLTGAGMILPMYFTGRHVWSWTRRQSRLYACRACGYDLRATPERCPECGAVPTTAVKGAA